MNGRLYGKNKNASYFISFSEPFLANRREGATFKHNEHVSDHGTL